MLMCFGEGWGRTSAVHHGAAAEGEVEADIVRGFDHAGGEHEFGGDALDGAEFAAVEDGLGALDRGVEAAE